MKLHRWGAQSGTVSVVWWDLWARRPCWEISRLAPVHMFDGTFWCGIETGQVTSIFRQVTCRTCRRGKP